MEIISGTSIVTAKKNHTCGYCEMKIEKGEKYETTTLKYDYIYRWKNHIRCSAIARKLNMFDNSYDDGLDYEGFKEFINIEFCNIYQTKHIDIYESKDFQIPTFGEQLEFVCNFHQV